MPDDDSGDIPLIEIMPLYNSALTSLNDGHGPRSYVDKGSQLLECMSRMYRCSAALSAGDIGPAEEHLNFARKYTDFTKGEVEVIEEKLDQLEKYITSKKIERELESGGNYPDWFIKPKDIPGFYEDVEARWKDKPDAQKRKSRFETGMFHLSLAALYFGRGNNSLAQQEIETVRKEYISSTGKIDEIEAIMAAMKKDTLQ